MNSFLRRDTPRRGIKKCKFCKSCMTNLANYPASIAARFYNYICTNRRCGAHYYGYENPPEGKDKPRWWSGKEWEAMVNNTEEL